MAQEGWLPLWAGGQSGDRQQRRLPAAVSFSPIRGEFSDLAPKAVALGEKAT